MDAPLPLILLIDEDPAITKSLASNLQNHGFEVETVNDGSQALEAAEAFQPDAILLDIVLAGMNGLEICRRLRAQSAVPIILLTARDEEDLRIQGLEAGADDYLTKPFYFRELLARIRAILRRVELDRQTRKSQTFSIGRIRLDPISRRVYKDHREIELSAREYDLLALLMNQAGQAISREALLEEIWGKEYSQDYRTLFVHIHWLRLKIEDDPADPKYIQNVRAFGYRFTHPESF